MGTEKRIEALLSRPVSKRGELLLYRPRSQSTRPTATPPATIATGSIVATVATVATGSIVATVATVATVDIRYGGQVFAASPEMARCFLANAQRVLEAHDAQSVALLHDGGLELLFIADNIPFEVGDTFRHPSCKESH